jgi:hypothetical protein
MDLETRTLHALSQQEIVEDAGYTAYQAARHAGATETECEHAAQTARMETLSRLQRAFDEEKLARLRGPAA